MHRASIHWRKASLCFLVYVVVQAVCASEAEEFDCTDRSNGDYEDPKSACASHYYSCFASTTLKRHCPKGLVYNPRLKRCDWRESVPGCGGANPDRRKPHFECPQRDGLFAVQDCSPQYWRCSGGEPVKMACAEGQAFDGRSKKCAAIGNVLACNLKIQQEVPKVRQEAPNDKRQAADVSKAAKQEIKKSGHRNEGRSDFCKSKSDGNFPSGDCSKSYVSCWNGHTYHRSCHGSLVFNPERKICDDPNAVKGCNRKINLPVVPKIKTTKPEELVECRDSSSIKPCHHTYNGCYRGQIIRRECPPNTVYSDEYMGCIGREFVPECHRDEPRESHLCHGRDRMIPLGECSDKYILCDNGRPYERLCPRGTVFHEQSQNCVNPRRVTTCKIHRRADDRPLKRQPICNSSYSRLPFKECSPMYLVCQHGQPTIYKCPEGRIWDSIYNHCVPPRWSVECDEFEDIDDESDDKSLLMEHFAAEKPHSSWRRFKRQAVDTFGPLAASYGRDNFNYPLSGQNQPAVFGPSDSLMQPHGLPTDNSAVLSTGVFPQGSSYSFQVSNPSIPDWMYWSYGKPLHSYGGNKYPHSHRPHYYPHHVHKPMYGSYGPPAGPPYHSPFAKSQPIGVGDAGILANLNINLPSPDEQYGPPVRSSYSYPPPPPVHYPPSGYFPSMPEPSPPKYNYPPMAATMNNFENFQNSELLDQFHPLHNKAFGSPYRNEEKSIHTSFCESKSDGTYAVNSCSNSYVVCRNHKTVVLSCNSGSIFDPSSSGCRDAGSSTGCGRGHWPRPTTVVTSTAAASLPSTQNSPPDTSDGNICSVLANGQYAVRPCSMFYYTCRSGVFQLSVCPREQVFEQASSRCTSVYQVLHCFHWQQCPVPYFQIFSRFSGGAQQLPQDLSSFYEGSPLWQPSLPNVGFSQDTLQFKPYTQCHSPNEIYSACGGACQPTCNGVPPIGCSLSCVPGCQCSPGYIRLSAFDATCVPFTSCGSESSQYSSSWPLLDSNFCLNKNNGFYSFPGQNCIDRYYKCSKNAAEIGVCPSNLVFDSVQGRCLTPEECRSITKPSAQNADPYFCRGKLDSAYSFPGKPCIHLYYICSQGTVSYGKCKSGTVFDSVQGCVSPSECTDSTSGGEGEDMSCAGRSNKNYAIAGLHCYPLYITCIDGKAKHELCPLDLVFNGKTCVTSEMCKKGGEDSGHSPYLTQPSTVIPHGFFDFCLDKPDGVYPLYNCVKLFAICVDGVATPHICHGNRVFAKVVLGSGEVEYRCVIKEFAICDDNAPPPTAPSVDGNSTFDNGFCFNKTDGRYPVSARKCEKFYIECYQSRFFLQRCPPTTVFNPDNQTCVLVYDCLNQISYGNFDHLCKDKSNGFHTLDERCSELYVYCQDGKGWLQSCGNELMAFDMEISMCRPKSAINECQPSRPHLPIPPPVTNGFDAKCRYMPDGGYEITPCQRDYIVCNMGYSMVKQCPSRYAFDSAAQTCVPLAAKYACNLEARKDPICANKLDGFYPTGPCARQYYICLAGIFVPDCCPPGQAFVAKLQKCLPKRDVPHCNPRTTTTTSAKTTAQDVPLTTPVAHIPTDPRCTSPGRIALGYCVSYFLYCMASGHGHVVQCGNGELFNEKLSACIDTSQCRGGDYVPQRYPHYPHYGTHVSYPPHKISGAEASDSPTMQRLPVVTTPARDVGGESLDTYCINLASGIYPYPGDCSRFIQCSNAMTTIQMCPVGLVFNPNPKVLVCDYVRNVPQCDTELAAVVANSAAADQPSVSSAGSQEGATQFCSSTQDEMIPYRQDCTKYIQCTHGLGKIRSCPGHLVFNPRLQVCDYAQNVPQCRPGVVATSADSGRASSSSSSSSSFSSSGSSLDPNFCADLEDGFYRHSFECSKFVQCFKHRSFILSCPKGLVFSPTKQVCDWHSKVPECNVQANPSNSESSGECSNVPNGAFLQYPNDKKKFIRCLNGHSYTFDCPRGLVYHPQTHVCGYPPKSSNNSGST